MGDPPFRESKYDISNSNFHNLLRFRLANFSQTEITSCEVISDLEKECKSQDEILQLLRERHTNTSQFCFYFHESSEMFYKYWVFEPYICIPFSWQPNFQSS